MSTKTIEASVRYAPGSSKVPIIDMRGDIDALGEDILNAAYNQASRQGPSAILLNFGGVEYINSTGIALIIRLRSRASETGCRLLACGLSKHYSAVFRMTRLSDFISIFPDEASALASVPVPA